MSESTSGILQKAHEFIEKDELEQARALVTPLLETDDENPSLWWVYSHSVRDRSIGQLALDRVIALDPAYPGAAELKADVLAVQEREDDLLGLEDDGESSVQTVADATIDDWEDLQPVLVDAEESSGGRRGFVLLVVVLLIVAIGAALVASGAVNLEELLSGLLPTEEPAIIVVVEPTEESEAVLVAGPTQLATNEVSPDASATMTEAQAAPATNATESDSGRNAEESSPVPTDGASDEPTEVTTAEVAATDAAVLSPTAESTATPLILFVRALAASIEEFELNNEASGIDTTQFGETLVLHVCAVPGREFNERLNRVMNAAVQLVDEAPEGIDAVAAGLLNCADPDATLRIIGVELSDVQAYADEEIDAKEFQRAWQPLS